MILVAMAEALASKPRFIPDCVVIGTTSGGMSLGEQFYRSLASGSPAWSATRKVRAYAPQEPVMQAMSLFGFTSPVRIVSNACASGTNALGLACEMIRAGSARRVLAGGYDALSQLVFAGFDCLRATTAEKCRPFDAARTGLSLGEGAAVFCLEKTDSDLSITGYGSSADGHHLTQPHPSGCGPLAAMRRALECAEADPASVEYINAHGTGTPLNDSSEARAILALCPNAPVSSTKSMTGHALGAAGAIEAAFCCLALREEFLPVEHQFQPIRISARHRRQQDTAAKDSPGDFEFLRLRRRQCRGGFGTPFAMIAAVAGMGWVTPWGRDLHSTWTAIRENNRANAEFLTSPVDGRRIPVLRVPNDSIKDTAAVPRLRRSSIISHLAVSAAVDAVVSARMDPDTLKRTALVFAASDGGVVYTRKFFAEIVERGEGAGSPLLFPETVYNAPASHIAARLGLECEVLTLVGDAAAGLSAVQTARELIAAGEAESCVVAAAQELDWITCEAYRRWGLIQDGKNSACVFSEGAAAIVLTEQPHRCRVSATHPGYSYSTEAETEEKFETMLTELLQGSPVDLVVSCASGTRFDLPERRCIAKHLRAARILTPKFVLGESFACSTLQQIITGVLALEEAGGGNALVVTTGYNRQVAGLVLTH